MSEPEYNDYPFDEICARADELIGQGATVFQKFTCVNCGERLTIDEPNKFYRRSKCDKCGAITDIEAMGCNYMLVFEAR